MLLYAKTFVKSNIKWLAFLFFLVSLLVGVASTFWMGDENPIEEACEAIIYAATGVNIDLSPSSSEH